MLLHRFVPSGDPIEPEQAYGDLGLEGLAPADRPYVVANFVASTDGKATVHGRSSGLGGPADRAAFHLLRSQVDAILAGSGTLRTENYGRLVRDAAVRQRRVEQGRSPQPLGVIISASGEVPWEIPLFGDPESRVAVFADPALSVPDTAAEVTLHPTPDPRELGGVLRRLREQQGVRSLLCEGGPTLFDAMLAAGLIDELFLTLAPVLAGGHELSVTAGRGVHAPTDLRLVTGLEYDGTLLLRYTRR